MKLLKLQENDNRVWNTRKDKCSSDSNEPQNGIPRSREILMFVCLQIDVKQCCYATKHGCPHCAGKRRQSLASTTSTAELWGITARSNFFFYANKHQNLTRLGSPNEAMEFLRDSSEEMTNKWRNWLQLKVMSCSSVLFLITTVSHLATQHKIFYLIRCKSSSGKGAEGIFGREGNCSSSWKCRRQIDFYGAL